MHGFAERRKPLIMSRGQMRSRPVKDSPTLGSFGMQRSRRATACASIAP